MPEDENMRLRVIALKVSMFCVEQEISVNDFYKAIQLMAEEGEMLVAVDSGRQN